MTHVESEAKKLYEYFFRVPFVWAKQNSIAQTEEFLSREREKIQSI